MSELLFPRSDSGVAIQAVVVGVLVALALWRSWRNPDLRLLVIGIGVVVFALMGLRAAH